MPQDTREAMGVMELWTAEETAKVLSCSVSHVLRMALLGQIPAVDLAASNAKHRMWRFRPESIREWIQRRERS